jgi:hypothetical protein
MKTNNANMQLIMRGSIDANKAKQLLSVIIETSECFGVSELWQ